MYRYLYEYRHIYVCIYVYIYMYIYIYHLKSYLIFIHETIYSENSFIVCLLAEYMKLCSERAKGLISENEEKPNF